MKPCKRRALISRSRKRLYSVEEVKPDAGSNSREELDKLRAQIKSLERDNAEIREAAERNAMKMIAVARKNSDYIDQLNQLKLTNNELAADVALLSGKMDDAKCELARQKSSFKSIADVAVKQREQIKQRNHSKQCKAAARRGSPHNSNASKASNAGKPNTLSTLTD